MKKIVVCAALAVALIVPATSAAAGNAKSGPTVGECISDGIYGNEPNMKNGAPGGPAEQAPGTKGGNVVPTQSPGPFTSVSRRGRARFGGPFLGDGETRNRTGDTTIFSRVLYQLSYLA